MIYRLVHAAAWPVFRLWLGFTVRGARHVPRTGGVIIAANHASYLDPPLFGNAVTFRPLWFMAKEELFRAPLLGRFIPAVHALPVRRGGVGRAQLRRFEAAVRREGRALLVFPEGTRTPDGRLGVPRRGVGAICRAAGVPVVPARIRGSFELWPRWRRFPRGRGRVEVRFGAPVEWSDEELNATGDPSGALAAKIMDRIDRLSESDEPATRFWSGYREILWRSRPARSGAPA